MSHICLTIISAPICNEASITFGPVCQSDPERAKLINLKLFEG